jgi:hypothetical protein
MTLFTALVWIESDGLDLILDRTVVVLLTQAANSNYVPTFTG